MNYEFIGIVGSLFVLLSFLFNGESRIRLLNAIGCIIFVIYGIFIGAFSVYFLNGVVLLINVYKGIRLLKEERNNESNKVS